MQDQVKGITVEQGKSKRGRTNEVRAIAYCSFDDGSRGARAGTRADRPIQKIVHAAETGREGN